MIEKGIERVLISKEEILAKSAKPSKQLTERHQGRNPLVVGILKGAVLFMADLTREVNTYLGPDFVDVFSYGNAAVSSGEVKTVKDLNTNVEGKHTLIVEDIIDNGCTLAYLVDLFRYRRVVSVKIATLLDRPEGCVVGIKADYVEFDVPNELVVGYGLDYAETYHNLPYIDVLRPEVYESNQYLSRN